MAYALLTPYLVPREKRKKKRANAGDGLILAAIRRMLLPAKPGVILSSRAPLSDRDIRRINSTKALVLAGANQLDDHFEIAPGVSGERLRSIRVPVIPFGIGLNGRPEKNTRLTPASAAALRAIHEKILYSSWRCPRTVDYLIGQLPELSGKALMTGCPTLFDAPLLEGKPFSDAAKTVVVAPTDKGDFWERETAVIDHVARRYPQARKILSLHQDFGDQELPRELRRYARAKGFKLFQPRSERECRRVYDRADRQIGSRLHAHLYFLGRAKPTQLVSIDGRSTGIAEAFGFPLADPRRLDDAPETDWERVRSLARAHAQTMRTFTDWVKKLV